MAVGAGAGALAGAGRHLLQPVATEIARKKMTGADGAMGAAARFGQRQVHALTGWKPQEGISALRMDAYDRKEMLDALKKRVGGANPPSAVELQRAQDAYDIAQKVEGAGLTSIPGLVKGFARSNDRLGLAKDLLRYQVKGQGPAGLAIQALYPASVGLSAATAATPEERNDQIGMAVGNIAGNVLMGPLPAFSQMVLSSPFDEAGKAVARVVSGRKPGAIPAKAPTIGPARISAGRMPNPEDTPSVGVSPMPTESPRYDRMGEGLCFLDLALEQVQPPSPERGCRHAVGWLGLPTSLVIPAPSST